MKNWYKRKANELFIPKIVYYSETLGMDYKNIMIRKMKKRWGNCTASKKIILNSDLIKAPKNCIKYVIIHALCHLKYQNHSNKFYQLQSYFLPNWEFWKNKLELTMS